MSRYDELKKMLNSGKEILPEDETTKANNGRNLLAGAVNPLIQEYVNPILPEGMDLSIPEMTVADQKNFDANLPEQMAGAAMGTINTNPSRFGKILQMGQKEAPKGFGKVTVIDSAADKAAAKLKEAQQATAAARTNPTTPAPSGPSAANITKMIEDKIGPELAKRRADMEKGLITPEEFASFKQEQFNQFRRRFDK